jgi:hypothetical protein
MSTQQAPRIVAFDLDETLGHFAQMGGFWDALEQAHGQPLGVEHFVSTLALYPEYVRPGMESLLGQVAAARNQGVISAVVLYTNNQGPPRWAEYIVTYFNERAGTQVFDMIVPAYATGGRRVSPCRTGHTKSPADLLRCTGMPPGTRICFIDDQYHAPMTGGGVYYIRVPPYMSVLFPADIADRYLAYHGARLGPAFRRRLGAALLRQTHGAGHSPLGADKDDATSWVRAHIGRFLALSQPEVTRRRPRQKQGRQSRRRGGGLTRRRRHALLWF